MSFMKPGEATDRSMCPELEKDDDIYRILIPSEWEALRDSIPLTRLRMVVSVLMFTGMRYTELQAFAGHLRWFDAKNRAITLPGASTKTGKARTIHLTPAFSRELELYLKEHKKLEVPGSRTMEENLERWLTPRLDIQDIEPWIPTPKTFRKSWESWLLAAGYPSMAVALSQGHSELISYGHYANLDPRLKSEMEQVKKLTEGWGT